MARGNDLEDWWAVAPAADEKEEEMQSIAARGLAWLLIVASVLVALTQVFRDVPYQPLFMVALAVGVAAGIVLADGAGMP